MLIRLRKTLHTAPLSLPSPLAIRSFRGEEDIRPWLEIRARALAGQIAAGRAWTDSDFRREFLEKSWWRPEWMWFAQEQTADGSWSSVGAAALRVMEPEMTGALQWLLVLPEHRRRGVGRRLLAELEIAAWNAGCRALVAETLDAWDAAVRFYIRLGYRKTPAGSRAAKNET